MKTFAAVAVGNAIIDVFLTIHEADIHFRVEEKDREFCIPYGEKIPVDDCQFLLGGGASNVSVGLSRMGLTSTLYVEIGDDEFSQKILNTLVEEKVDFRHLVRTKGAASSFSIGINFKGERTLFVKHVERAHNFVFEDEMVEWVYLGGLGKEWQEAYKSTLRFVEKGERKLAFAPGTTQVQAGLAKIIEVLRKTTILFVNKEEAVEIVNRDRDKENIKFLLEKLQKMGPKIVMMTDGRNGSYSIDENGQVLSLGIFPTNVVEKTGAGDAYAAGFLAARILGKPVKEAMRCGAANAAAVIEKVGSQRGLLRKGEMEQRLKEHNDIQPKAL